MSQGDDLFKSLKENFESIKNQLPEKYHNQFSHNGHYNNQYNLLQEMQNQQQPYGRNNNIQDYQNQQYAGDSPEPEMFDYANMNEFQEQQQQPIYQNRGGFKQQQQGGYNSTQKPYFKKNYEQNGRRQFNNEQGINQYQQNPTGGYQGQRKPYYNKFSGQQVDTNRQGQSYGGAANLSAKYQGQKPERFNNPSANQFNSNSHYQGQQYQAQSESIPQGEKPTGGNHIAGTKIFVNNIENTVNGEEIMHYFQPYGQINDLKVFHRNDQNYAYVIFEKYEDAFKAANDPSPQPNWSVSLAKSKNTVMQYQQSSLFNSQTNGNNPNPPFTGPNKFHNSGNNYGAAPYKKPFNKFSQDPSQPNQVPSRYEKQTGGRFGQNRFDQQQELVTLPNNQTDYANSKTQINQTILVREIWISNIDEKCKPFLRDIIEDNFGGIEEVEFFDRGKDSFAFVKFFMVITAYHAFANKEKIAELLETDQVKLTYSDPSRRRNIIGDNENYMQDENLSTVLYISFPYGFKVNKGVIQKIAGDYGEVLNVTVKRSEDQKQTSSVLVEFKELKYTKFAFKHMREDQEMHPKCEFAILLNSEKFVRENNLKLKEKIKGTQPPQVSAPYGITQKPIQQQKKPYLQGKTNLNSSLQDIAGIPTSKPIQSRGRQFSPEKEADINSKRTYNQHKQSQLNSSQDEGYNPDQQEQFQVDDDGDEIWSGFISINKIGRCGMDANAIQSQGQLDFENHNLVITIKRPIQEPFKFSPYSVVIFKPSNETYIKPFKDVKAFLNSTPEQASVINTKNFLIYLLPNCKQAQQIYPQVKESNIVALVHTADSIKGNTSKKEAKYDNKMKAKNQLNNSQDEEEDNLVYDPSSILQDTSRPNNRQAQKYQLRDEYQDEDIYDPNQINISKDDTKNDDLSDLLENPSLLNDIFSKLN